MNLELRRRFLVEEELILCCARTRNTPESQRRIEDLLSRGVDWKRVVGDAATHGVIPLLSRHLKQAAPDAIPEHVNPSLERVVFAVTANALAMHAEFERLARLFSERSIPVLALKGPTLAKLAYGTVGLRSFGDLDFLVHPSDYEAARELVLAQGYRPMRQFTPEEEAEYVAGEKSFEFIRGRLVVEIHWSVLHDRNTYIPDTEELWTRAQQATFGSASVLTLPTEDLLFYLCAHGASHYWGRLKWLCDIAELLHLYQAELDWEYILELARRQNGTRMLLLGLLLAVELLDAPLPAHLEGRARDDFHVARLVGLAPQWIFRPPQGPRLSFLREYFTFALQDRTRDRIPFLLSLVARSMQLSERDKALVDLPERARHLYYVVRPFRIISGLVSRRS